MKIRLGFVSNSSSSSFTCDFTGCTESGWDLSLSQAGMYECEHGHTFYEKHIMEDVSLEELKSNFRSSYPLDDKPLYSQEELAESKDDAARERREKANDRAQQWRVTIHATIDEYEGDITGFIDEMDEAGAEGRSGLPTNLCPLCRLKGFSTGTLLAYMLVTHKVKQDALEAHLRSEFGTLKNLQAEIKRLGPEEDK